MTKLLALPPFTGTLLLLVVTALSSRVAFAFTLTPSSCISDRHTKQADASTFSVRTATSSTAVLASCNAEHENSGTSTATSLQRLALSLALAVSVTSGLAGVPSPAVADEYGVETEAPTLFTGETVMICKKRGPLGACLKSEARTAENDNDKASKYMKSPEGEVRNKDLAMRAAASEQDGGELLKRLRQQTEDNRERNEKIVAQKTFENDQSANLGPFDRQTFIKNADGDGYTVLENPQAMRLKKAGYIKGRKFVKQPSQDVIDEALEGPGIGDVIMGFFCGSGDDGGN